MPAIPASVPVVISNLDPVPVTVMAVLAADVVMDVHIYGRDIDMPPKFVCSVSINILAS